MLQCQLQPKLIVLSQFYNSQSVSGSLVGRDHAMHEGWRENDRGYVIFLALIFFAHCHQHAAAARAQEQDHFA